MNFVKLENIWASGCLVWMLQATVELLLLHIEMSHAQAIRYFLDTFHLRCYRDIQLLGDPTEDPDLSGLIIYVIWSMSTSFTMSS